MNPKALLATLLLAAVLTALWLAARPSAEPPIVADLTQPVDMAPSPPGASPATVFVSPLSPLPTPRPALTATSLPAVALPGRSAAGRPTRIIDGTPAPTATRGPSPTPPFTPTPTHAPRIENVRLGPDLRITYLDDGRPFIYNLTDGSNRPAEPGAAAQPALTPAPQTGTALRGSTSGPGAAIAFRAITCRTAWQPPANINGSPAN
jgi:hypothetical protein